MDYDINRYFYLLEQEKSLYKVNREDYLELLSYKVRLENNKYWEN